MKQWFTLQRNFFWIALLTVIFLSFAGYLQYYKGLLPCPLCQLQRIMLGAAGLTAFFAWIHKPKKKGIRVYGYFVVAFCAIGALLAARQIYLQTLPPSDTPTTCGVGIDYIFGSLPFLDALGLILKGTGDCAQVHWRLIGLSLPEWTFVAFLGLGVLGYSQAARAKKLR